MAQYFLSYSRTDDVIALRFANDLIAAGIPVWVDQYDIRPSEHWDRAVEAAVCSCEGLIVILSPRSAASPNVADEVSVAIGGGKSIIPILVEKCTVPLRMTRMQFIDATVDYDRALQRCLAEIGRKTSPASDAQIETLPPKLLTPQLAADVIDAAIRRLTPLVGPIAAVLVRAAATRSATEASLYEALAPKIHDLAHRVAFLKSATGNDRTDQSRELSAPTPQASVSADELDRLVAVLTRSLGPIAAHLARREQRAASSSDDLKSRLARLLPTERAKAEFLKQAASQVVSS